MELSILLSKINDICKQYIGLGNLKVVDKDGKEISEINFDIENNKLILK